ncbi:MAG: PhnD/SsuA/transferrin family substrate-binding protein [Anaerolineaceae bacterium]|nr:PhnD/SsuA/transferrin family substrate-binding protein [Anaerolineaceae bacterium]
MNNRVQFPQRFMKSLILLLILPLIAVGCGDGISRQESTQTAVARVTQAAATATPEPLGSQANPIRMGYVVDLADNASLTAGGNVAARLGELTGYSVELAPHADYITLMTSLYNHQVHMVWLPPVTAISTQKLGLANAALIVNHYGVYAYGTQFMANMNQGATAYFDPVTNTNTADPVTALGQFAGLRPCWVESESIAGYIIPAGILSQIGVITQPAVWSQTSSAVIRSLYVEGVCDFGATYSISGDPRTASDILNDLPDVMNQVQIIWRSDAIIPNISMSLTPDVDEKTARELTTAWMEMGKELETLTWLSTMLNYDVQAFRTITNSYFDALRTYLDVLHIDPHSLIGK